MNKILDRVFLHYLEYNDNDEEARDLYLNFKEFINAHNLTKEQLEDKEYIDSLYENYIENTN